MISDNATSSMNAPEAEIPETDDLYACSEVEAPLETLAEAQESENILSDAEKAAHCDFIDQEEHALPPRMAFNQWDSGTSAEPESPRPEILKANEDVPGGYEPEIGRADTVSECRPDDVAASNLASGADGEVEDVAMSGHQHTQQQFEMGYGQVEQEASVNWHDMRHSSEPGNGEVEHSSTVTNHNSQHSVELDNGKEADARTAGSHDGLQSSEPSAHQTRDHATAPSPAPAVSNSNKLFLGGLPWETNEDGLVEYFGRSQAMYATCNWKLEALLNEMDGEKFSLLCAGCDSHAAHQDACFLAGLARC